MNYTTTIAGLTIEAKRAGVRVTGRVVFPYPVNNRTSIPIDYRSQRPGANRVFQSRDREGAVDDRARQRLAVIERYHELVAADPSKPKRDHLRQAAREAPLKCSPRSIQIWIKKYETEGIDGLVDNYTAAPPRTLTIEADLARDAVTVAAWWAFRIGNLDAITNKTLTPVLKALRDGYQVGDLLAVIDCYFSWPCDRMQFPFKPLSRWIKYDLITWVIRAAREGDYRRACLDEREQQRLQTRLQPPTDALLQRAQVFAAGTADAPTRQREVNHRPTQRAIAGLPAADARSPAEPLDDQVVKDRRGMYRQAHKLGLKPDRSTFESTAPGPAPVVSGDPQTVAEALARLDDTWRLMLIRASRSNTKDAVAARQEAIATVYLWWEALPQTTRNNIDFRVRHWQTGHGATDAAATKRRVDLVLNEIRKRPGAQTLAVAARRPA